HKYCPNIFFNYNDDRMIFTSVLGHLYGHDFQHKGRWTDSNPYDLFDSPIEKTLSADAVQISENIKHLASTADLVVAWTDCDREGENIAMQIQSLVPRKKLKRARFSAISRSDVENALSSLSEINAHESAAVDARIELDLRIGSSFTRLQTLSYAQCLNSDNFSSNVNMFNKTAGQTPGKENNKIISFGPCQIPTLNFVVQRYKQIQEFTSEPFYTLENIVKIKNNKANNVSDKEISMCFKWNRGNIFDKNCVIHFYNALKNSSAVITNKVVSDKVKYRPLPLRTVEFQKTCSSYFRMSGHQLMNIAEKLYNNGYISYPRTETDAYPSNFNFKSIISKLAADRSLEEYASNFKFLYPRSGKNNDQAHSPIYPLKAGNELEGPERQVYEFVARRYLACISENAKGEEIEYTLSLVSQNSGSTEANVEKFTCRGLNILERNYLDVYFYDKWENIPVADLEINQQIENNLEIRDGKTTAPGYLTESELIALMDKNGIGTDATIHEHIQKIQNREYVRRDGNKYIIPMDLGINLIDIYNSLDLNIGEPDLRKKLEESLKKICLSIRRAKDVVDEEVVLYKKIYTRLEEGIGEFKRNINKKHDFNIKKDNDSDSGDDRGPSRKKPANRVTGKAVNKPSVNIAPAFAPRDNNDRDNSNGPDLKCNCGESAKMLTAKKGANKGRSFYTCFYFPKKCEYFLWEDQKENAINMQQSNNRNNGENRYNSDSRFNNDSRYNNGENRFNNGENRFNNSDSRYDNRNSDAVNKRNIDELKCNCGYDPIRKVAHTETNNGRGFYCCNKNYKKCKFFKWEDEL
ncbi:DNA topoisomerase III, partial [Enteropsectra breve]